MKNSEAYRSVITKFVFAFIVLMISARPVVNYINHVFNHTDDDIELCEDFDEENTSEEIVEFTNEQNAVLVILDVTSIQKISRKKSTDSLLDVLLDVPIPPPKQL